MSDQFVFYEDNKDEFKMWQGLKGPYYIPYVDENGILSWTNTGDLPNPQSVNITGPAGSSFDISGIVATVSQLPSSGEGVWLVGSEPPYEGYTYISGAWEDIGQFAIGPKGDTGDTGATGAAAGFGTPSATVTATTGTPSVSVTASGPDTAKVFDFAFSGLKGETGQQGTGIGSVTLASGTHSPGTTDTYNVNLDGGTVAGQFTVYNGSDGQGSPGASIPLVDSGTGSIGSATAYSREDHQHPLNVAGSGTPQMDGTASLGSSGTYARTDHVHPSDTSRASQNDLATGLATKQDTLASGTNIKTVNGQSLLGSGNLAAIPTGGAAGKALVKASAANYDVTWGDAGGALWFTNVAISATTGDIATISNSAITANHVLGRIEWANPPYITTDVTWTTSAGSLVLNGTASAATTANILLVLKNN